MALSYIKYTGDGSTKDFTFPFMYLDAGDIGVFVGPTQVAFTLTNASAVKTTVAPASGAVIRIRRLTSKVSVPVNFSDGSNLLERDLDLLGTWTLYQAQEAADVSSDLGLIAGQPLDTSIAAAVQANASAGQASTSAASANAAVASLTPGPGAGMVGYDRSLTYATGTVGAALQNLLNVKNFGAIGDGIADDTAAIAAAWAVSKRLSFPQGNYKVSSLPNFAVNNASIVGTGEVWINFTGTGNGMSVDSGSTPGNRAYGILIENIGISGTTACTNGLYIRGIVHSVFRRIRVKNTSLSGLRAEFMVSNTIDNFVCSGNQSFTTLPINGIILEKRGTGEQCSNCTWISPIIEGTSGDGIVLNEAAVNTFIGGTSEGNGFGGGAGAVYVGPNSFSNTFIGLDLEHNGKVGDATSYHVKSYGVRDSWINVFCDSALSGLFWAAGGNSLTIRGGQLHDLRIDSGVKNLHTSGMAFAGTITDAGADTRHIQRYSIPGAATLPDSQMNAVAWTPTSAGLAISGTPTYSGMYQKTGRLVTFTILITSTTSTANAGGAWLSLPVPAAVVGTCSGASNNTGQAVGKGVGSIAATVCYPPTWTADSNITISGSYFSA